ncbi:WD40 repeat domain-containing protein [Streptosporangium fragile]
MVGPTTVHTVLHCRFLPSWPQVEHLVRALAFHPGGHLLATGGADGTTRLWVRAPHEP